MIADNRVAELAEQDDDVLKGLLEELSAQDIDLDLTGFTAPDISSLLEEGQAQGGKPETDEPELGKTEDLAVENQFGVIVMCATEKEQEDTFNKLTGEGYYCKVVTV